MKNGEKLQMYGFDVTAHHTPCYTSGHMMYECKVEGAEVKSDECEVEMEIVNGYQVIRGLDSALFTGDTLFVAGCGSFLEGTAEDMVNNMKLIRQFPPNTNIFPGHDFAINNYRYSLKIDQNNTVITLLLN